MNIEMEEKNHINDINDNESISMDLKYRKGYLYYFFNEFI
jgi:hypothetical protein